jgi:hypothetical protein
MLQLILEAIAALSSSGSNPQSVNRKAAESFSVVPAVNGGGRISLRAWPIGKDANGWPPQAIKARSGSEFYSL